MTPRTLSLLRQDASFTMSVAEVCPSRVTLNAMLGKNVVWESMFSVPSADTAIFIVAWIAGYPGIRGLLVSIAMLTFAGPVWVPNPLSEACWAWMQEPELKRSE